MWDPSRYSPDGRWYWDGNNWVAVAGPPATTPIPPPGYRSARTPGHWTVGLLCAMAAALGVWLVLYGLDALTQLDPTTDPTLGGGLAVLGMLFVGAVGIPTAILFIVWLRRSSQNVRAFGAQQLRYSPVWAIVCWFIPYANIYFPLGVVHEVWQASDPRTMYSTKQSRRGLAVLPLVWWIGFYLGLNLLYLAVFLRLDMKDRSSAMGVDVFGMVACLLTALSAGPAIALVLRLNRRQAERSGVFT